MRIEVQRVFGAAERLQPVTEAPSSVTIVTSDQIARYGYRTLADILRSVRGFYVSNDRNYSYLGVRGFARPGKGCLPKASQTTKMSVPGKVANVSCALQPSNTRSTASERFTTR